MLTCTGPSDISALLITEMRVTTGRALTTMADSVGGWESVVPHIAERGLQVRVSTTGKASPASPGYLHASSDALECSPSVDVPGPQGPRGPPLRGLERPSCDATQSEGRSTQLRPPTPHRLPSGLCADLPWTDSVSLLHHDNEGGTVPLSPRPRLSAPFTPGA